MQWEQWITLLTKFEIRKLVLLFFIIMTLGSFFAQRKRAKQKYETELDLSSYEKNEAGQYPWEADTDDSPDRIAQNATRYRNQNQPKRGGW